MNQLTLGFKLFFQSIIFSFKHAQLFLYIGAYFLAHYLIGFLLLPTLNLNIQNIVSFPAPLLVLALICSILSFLLLYVLIIAITDYTSHVLHNQSETMMHSVKKGFSKLGSITAYGLLRLFFVAIIFAAAIVVSKFAPDSVADTGSLLKAFVVIAVPSILWLICEAITFYFFPAITLSNLTFSDALGKSWHLVRETFFAIITFLILWSILVSFLSNWNPQYNSVHILSIGTYTNMFGIVFFSIFSYTVFTVFKTLLYEKASGTLPKQYDPEK